MEKLKKFIVVSLVLTIGVAFFAVKTMGTVNNKISPFLTYSPKEEVPIIVELNSSPVTVYERTFKYRILSLFAKDESEKYSRKLEKTQMQIVSYIKKFNAKVKFRYTYLFNGFSCTVKGKYVNNIAQIQNVKRIFKDRKAYLERTYATKVIKSDVVNRMTDSSNNYITGKGIVVGIVDTGIDYNDKELGSGGFPNSKVIGGYNFADMNNDPMDTDGHGTHVAGIIAGSHYGVAPDAKIRAYKVFKGKDETTATSVIIEGVEQAVKDKCNVINISIGTPGGEGDGSDPESIAVENAVASGVVVVAAAGNSGCRSELVPFPMSSPASNKDVIGVGASDDAMHGVILLKNEAIVGMYPDKSPIFNSGNYGAVYCGYGEEKDFIGKNLKGKIALIQRGKIYFGDKDLNAKRAGAVGVIVFNNTSGLPPIALVSKSNPDETNFIPFLFVSYANGMYLKQYVNDSVQIKLDNKYGLGRMSTFSSNGPTIDFYPKPDIVAPGINISSTVLNNKTAVMTGTSMAAPFVTGSAALIKQAKSFLKPDEIKALMMNTAEILKNPDSLKPYSPLLQGAGRINVENAISSNALVEPASFIFGNGTTEKNSKFTVKNLSNSNLTFSISSEYFSNTPVTLTYPDSIYVAPFSESSFTVHFDADKSIKGNAYGFIYLNSNNTHLHIPFVYIPSFRKPTYLENVFQKGDVLTENIPIKINFTVGMGTENNSTPMPFRENIADEIKINVYDKTGKFIDTIFDKSPIYIGDYSLMFKGKDIFGNSFLNNGKYYYKIMYLKANNDELTKTIEPIIIEDQKSGSFIVSNANANAVNIVPENDETLLLEKDEDFWVDVLLQLKNPNDGLSISYKYDSALLKILDVKKGPAILSNQVGFADNTEQAGIVQIVLSGKLTKSGEIARIHFKAIDNGTDLIYLASTEEHLITRPLQYTISDYSRIWDLNNDKKVDDADIVIFKKGFGMNNKDTGFNTSLDFNKDNVINGKDFLILTRHYGEIYP